MTWRQGINLSVKSVFQYFFIYLGLLDLLLVYVLVAYVFLTILWLFIEKYIFPSLFVYIRLILALKMLW